MGSSDSGDSGEGLVDCSVGSIVWVRRRNGSWWPGKILGPDELSASHLMAPRSGTPVKLLGREDASVDWYNLEKSKRVKAFRCGEFDGCIERAEASQGMPPKKREKYARREDAILHALELEKQLLDKKYGNLGEQTGDDSHGKKSRSIYSPAEFIDLVDTDEGPHNQMEMRVSQPGECNSFHHPGAFAEETTSGSSEDTESDLSETDSMGPDVAAELTALSDAHTNSRAQSRALSRLALQGRDESTSSEDMSSPDDSPHFHFHDPVSSSMEVSKWQLKGKRNTRNLNRRSTDGFTHGMYLEARGRSLSQRTSGHTSSYYHDSDDYINDVDFIEDDCGPHVDGFGNRGYLHKLKSASQKQNFLSQKSIDWEELTWRDRSFKQYLDEKGGFFNHAYVGRHGQMLIDVDLHVQANHKGEHVPWVSLMSKLNGKAIIGHPIQVETLGDGSTDALLSTSSHAYDDNGNRVVPQVWRTARRTAFFRVPRPHSSSQHDGDDADYQYSDEDRKLPPFKKSAATGSLHEKSLGKRSLSHVPRPPPHRLKKPSKKVGLSASQKTRALSSIGSNQKLSDKRRVASNYYFMDGVIKPLVPGPTTVACIPVKLVFSRLLEAVGRSPSGPTSRGVSVNSNKERNPS
ncbi:hypothetical protein Nepgr_030024 [Nepenthes gracilis]|uniref:PWWP domain-containing protein n=1 Tax=Nepenthes gracilis TaxID=150966 RepID=A0AAD3TFF6_NEPGR|nr:hypothetical protein Nepgr_030024 [Nepenthes gracilis]